ncbi:MAG: choice-of-anchor Q domain-containing protein, partial [Candidatus Sumerlaeia bacterium]
MNPSKLFSILCLLMLALAPAAFAQVQCDTTAEIEAAVAGASDGDDIRIAAGNYPLTAGTTMTLTAPNVSISGGWDATFTTQAGETILDAEGNHRVFMIEDTADNFVISTLTLTGGDAEGLSAIAFGGGIYAKAGGAIRNCLITDCSAYRGGAIAVDTGDIAGSTVGGQVLIDSCELTSNTSTEDVANRLLTTSPSNGGGGVYAHLYSDVRVINTIFLRNTAYDHCAAFGATSCTVNFINNTIVDNRLIDLDLGDEFEPNVAVFIVQNNISGAINNNIFAHNTVNDRVSGPNFGSLMLGTFTATNNLFYDNVGSYAQGDNAFNSDPIFVSTTEGSEDLHITDDSSAAINNGSDSDNPPTLDKDGNPRPVQAYDIGAYEYQTIVAVPMETYYITEAGGGAGTSWDSPIDMDRALALALSGAGQGISSPTLYVQGGWTYSVASTIVCNNIPSLSIMGSFDPSLSGTTTGTANYDVDTWPTTIDCGGDKRAFQADNDDGELRLYGLKIINGGGSGGAAIYTNGFFDLYLTNCIFDNNDDPSGSGGRGGAVYQQVNKGTNDGLAIMHATSCTFTNNDSGAKDGGAVCIRLRGPWNQPDGDYFDNETIFTDCHFENNTCLENGAGVFFKIFEGDKNTVNPYNYFE